MKNGNEFADTVSLSFWTKKREYWDFTYRRVLFVFVQIEMDIGLLSSHEWNNALTTLRRQQYIFLMISLDFSIYKAYSFLYKSWSFFPLYLIYFY